MVLAPNWQEVEEKLFSEGMAAIRRFAQEHPTETCSFFAYACIPTEGSFSVCIDTPQNALRQAQEDQQEALEGRKTMLQWSDSWQRASSYLCQSLVTYSAHVDLFTYIRYANIYFEGWQEFTERDQYPQGPESADDFLEGNIRMVLWRALDRLVESGVFSHLRLSSPFRLGYQFPEEDLVVLRLLNWPSVL